MLSLLLGLMLSAPAAADSIGIADCSVAGGDISVALSKLDGAREIDAQVVEKQADKYHDFQAHKSRSSQPGVKLVYRAEGFELRLDLRARRVQKRIPSHVEAKTSEGRQISADLLCDLY